MSTKAFHPGELAVLEEACRIKDRLDLFAAILDGDAREWARILARGDDKPAVLIIDAAVTEARLHAGELRQLIERLRLPMAMAGDGAKEGDDVDDDLAAARAARSRRKAGSAGP